MSFWRRDFSGGRLLGECARFTPLTLLVASAAGMVGGRGGGAMLDTRGVPALARSVREAKGSLPCYLPQREVLLLLLSQLLQFLHDLRLLLLKLDARFVGA